VFTQNSVLPAIHLHCANIHPPFASATIYAGFTSLPGLFSTLLATLVGDTSSVAVGACLGSAMLNQLVAISAGISIALNYHHCSSIKVEMAEVGRDIVFTGLSIIAVFLVLLDEVVTVIEAAALVGLYGLYVMLCWHQAVRIKCFFLCIPFLLCVTNRACSNFTYFLRFTQKAEDLNYESILPENQESSSAAANSGSSPLDEENVAQKPADSAAEGDERNEEYLAKKDDSAEVPTRSSTSIVGKLRNYVFSGLSCFFVCISPEPRLPPENNFDNFDARAVAYIRMQLAVGIFGQVILVWLLLAWSEKAGCLLGISPLVVGATVSASACAAPTYLASCSLSRLKGDMCGSIANALGSNIFSLLIALGLPWLLELSIRLQGQPLVAGAVNDTIFVLGLLFASLIAMASSLVVRKMTQTVVDGTYLNH